MKTFLILFCIFKVFAHGEDTPGPHGGSILMPGNYHTEAVSVPGDATSVGVYLLDIKFKNPIVKNSEVKAFVVYNKLDVKVDCKAVQDHFVCKSRFLSKAFELVVKSKRDGVEGADVRYALPLKGTLKK